MSQRSRKSERTKNYAYGKIKPSGVHSEMHLFRLNHIHIPFKLLKRRVRVMLIVESGQEDLVMVMWIIGGEKIISELVKTKTK